MSENYDPRDYCAMCGKAWEQCSECAGDFCRDCLDEYCQFILDAGHGEVTESDPHRGTHG